MFPLNFRLGSGTSSDSYPRRTFVICGGHFWPADASRQVEGDIPHARLKNVQKWETWLNRLASYEQTASIANSQLVNPMLRREPKESGEMPP
jgi:hypothetical protein